MTAGLGFFAVPGLPMVQSGDDLANLLAEALSKTDFDLTDADVVCIAQKIVSKAEGRAVPLAKVQPGPEAVRLARETEKDPRLVQLILDESTEVMRQRPGVLIVRHRLGFVCAHAGIDQSNIDHGDGEHALLLPTDPDRSAAELRTGLFEQTGRSVGVVITDSHNRPWRLGTVGMAIGASGIGVLDDRRGTTDLYGRELRVTLSNRADAIAAAATLLMGETIEQVPVVIARAIAPPESGATPESGAADGTIATGVIAPLGSDDTAKSINRPLEEDLFR